MNVELTNFFASFFSHPRKRSSDIISMLVNIYGSKELFVNEYRTLLSNRLLSQFTYNTEREIRNLELLKLRFGDAPLHQCEVMLKDISDSKRINHLLHSGEEGSPSINFTNWPVNATIVSAQFWPQFKAQDNLELPTEINQGLKAYTKAFEGKLKSRLRFSIKFTIFWDFLPFQLSKEIAHWSGKIILVLPR